MEYLLVGFVALFIFAVVLAPGKSKSFEKPKVSAISDEALRAFEAAPSLWVNGSEHAFFAALKPRLPHGFDLHGKVRLEDIIRVRRGVEAKTRWSLRGRVKSRHVDYVITRADGRPVLAIELDGKSHNARKPSEADRVKSALFNAVGIPLRRVRVGEDFHHIAATIGADLTLR